MKMSNKTYDILKEICTKWTQALATLILVVCQIWNLPYGEQVAATVTAIGTCIGIMIGISSKNYWSDSNARGYIDNNE